MLLNVYTVFNRVDGVCDNPILGRSDDRIATEFSNMLYKRNLEITQKHFPPVDPSEYEIRKVAEFEDTTGEIRPITPSVVPFSLPSLPLE